MAEIYDENSNSDFAKQEVGQTEENTERTVSEPAETAAQDTNSSSFAPLEGTYRDASAQYHFAGEDIPGASRTEEPPKPQSGFGDYSSGAFRPDYCPNPVRGASGTAGEPETGGTQQTAYSTAQDFSSSSPWQGQAFEQRSEPKFYRAYPDPAQQAAESAAHADGGDGKKKKGSAGKKVLLVLAVAVLIAASLGIGMAVGKMKSKQEPSESTGAQDTTSPSVAVEVATTNAYANQLSAVDVADKVRPSVVGVMAYLNGQLEGEGSGVLFCEDKEANLTYVMTCAHVISDEGLEFSILTLDGKPYDAKLVGFDERTDIGVLKIEATGLSIATLGDSTALKIGEDVFAIGNPGGSEYFGSMTSGIISAIDRSISSKYTMKVIQHDAAINPGNSGGALVNTSGQIVGINSSKIASTDFEGMGFAVPMSTAKEIAESLIAYGYVPNRPMLGIQYSDVSNYQFYSMLVGIKDLPQGSLIISSVADNSDLAGKDVKSGDLIIAVNGVNLDTSDILLDLIEKSKVGDELTLTICRVDTKSYKTSTFEVKVKLVEDKNTTYSDQEETTAQNPGMFPFGGSDYYSDFFREFFGF